MRIRTFIKCSYEHVLIMVIHESKKLEKEKIKAVIHFLIILEKMKRNLIFRFSKSKLKYNFWLILKTYAPNIQIPYE